MPASTDQIDLYDPAGYVAAAPHEHFARLRREQPVFRQEMPDGTHYWALLKHADVVDVSKRPELFSAERGGVVLEDQPPEQLEQTKNMLLMMDPPRHSELRKKVYPHFRPRQVSELEPRIREICRELCAMGVEKGELEFVHELAALIPSQVFGELMGIPQEDRAQINRWAEMMTGGQDPDLNPDGYTSGSGNEGSVEMAMYGMRYAQARRGYDGEPRDLGDLLLATEIDGRSMDDMQFAYFFVQVVTAGNDTTRTMISSGLLELVQHPDQLALLREDRSLAPSALEEILRYAPPLHYFRRTLSADTEVRGQPIRAGEKIAMIYTSTNRDEDVFTEPDTFDIRRHPNPHLAFGIGEHFCLGVHLARLEGRIFLEEMLGAWSDVELTDEPKRQRSNLNNALKSLPVRIRAA
ncbi:MAG TPA: cytochrome P450 [Acidimicrobiia bacterium]|jgi:cytochrome P450